jgi:hypothetical protein
VTDIQESCSEDESYVESEGETEDDDGPKIVPYVGKPREFATAPTMMDGHIQGQPAIAVPPKLPGQVPSMDMRTEIRKMIKEECMIPISSTVSISTKADVLFSRQYSKPHGPGRTRQRDPPGPATSKDAGTKYVVKCQTPAASAWRPLEQSSPAASSRYCSRFGKGSQRHRPEMGHPL